MDWGSTIFIFKKIINKKRLTEVWFGFSNITLKIFLKFIFDIKTKYVFFFFLVF